MKYQKFSASGCKDIEIRKVEFVAKTQFWFQYEYWIYLWFTYLHRVQYMQNKICNFFICSIPFYSSINPIYRFEKIYILQNFKFKLYFKTKIYFMFQILHCKGRKSVDEKSWWAEYGSPCFWKWLLTHENLNILFCLFY